MTEEWRPTHHPNYEVSNLGRVRSYAKRGGAERCGRYDVPHLLAAHPNRQGYPQVSVAGLTVRVHRLVAAAFIGPCPEGQEVRHKDDNTANPAASNLEYGTRSQNIRDSVSRGRYNNARRGGRGERNPRASLSSGDIQEIRSLRDCGLEYAEIAAQFGVGPGAIGKIIRGERWQHVA